MYDVVHIRNSRCLRDVRFELSPLTVLVGPNAAGKSALLRALTGELGSAWRGRKDVEVSITLQRGEKRYYHAERNAEDFIVDRPSPLPVDAHQRVALDPDAIRRPNQLAQAVRLEPNGQNAANLFASLRRSQQIELARHLCGWMPAYGDIDTDPLSDGYHRVVLRDRWNEKLWYPPDELADGTVQALALLLLGFQDPAPELVAIEHPETSIHPYLLGELVSFLRSLTTGKSRDPVQIVLTTHSADLLDHVDPAEVRVLSRDEAGATRIAHLDDDEPMWADVLEMHGGSLGGMWLAGGLTGPAPSHGRETT